MNILSVENISKSYGEKILFENISFSIGDTDKIGLIGVNGTGKSSLLKIIAGYDVADTGKVHMPSKMAIEYLSQNPEFDPNATILEQVFKSDSQIMNVIRDYENILEEISQNPDDSTLQKKLLYLTDNMNAQDAWEIENQVKTILTKLGIHNFHQKIETLSGGQKKRVALASALISPCDLLILDEPTNHMDHDTIDWLEKYLTNRTGSLLMITHDRYFLDRVVNKTLELDDGKIYSYIGNYSQFIEKKLERKTLESSIERKRERLYKKELEWIRAGAQARSTKQKARIQRFEELKNTSSPIHDSNIDICVAHSRLGQKIIEINHISKSFEQNKVIEDFSYIALKDDRIGIIGKNGTGKSTLLNLITGKLTPDLGSIDIGPTVKIGYFSQESEDMDINLRAIEYIKEKAEYITTEDGIKISASQMMENFLFSKDLQWTYISKLSGGERRRLYLLRILMDAPNVLILDEPTNDLDIDTLKVLENYIDDFNGIVICVSHDRYFLDRICNKIFFFAGDGKIIEHTGNYSDFYKSGRWIHEEIKEEKNTKKSAPQKPKEKKLKFTYNEQREYETIDQEIENLENKLSTLEEEMKKYSTDFTKLQELMNEKDYIEEELLLKMERQEYLNDLAEKIKNDH
ncbi:ABC-F family ATP-binding cassette domain-containing protein [Inediibacterium massiliense]|uniref:ABC-F family ATP-binding cassette domain-containing protein n=1 Tax=Inediibacterium massiliense TaxID=1658111 RepID=UPI0006B600A7|nr:ABC-F family ATP-binding cassette domain-containing protein [Inediibacterium massiliense]